MIATPLILLAALLGQAQAPAAAPKGNDAPATRAMTPEERAQYVRETSIAKRKAERQKKAQFQAAQRARAAQQEAMMRDYELKMAPIVAAQQIEMARLRLQEQQAAFNQQAIVNAQQFQAARLAQENQRLQLQYWQSQQPIQVIIKP
jgi:hypothetical protein